MTEQEIQIDKLANGVMMTIFKEDNTGKLLRRFVMKICALSKLAAFDACIENDNKFVVISKNEYEELIKYKDR